MPFCIETHFRLQRQKGVGRKAGGLHDIAMVRCPPPVKTSEGAPGGGATVMGTAQNPGVALPRYA